MKFNQALLIPALLVVPLASCSSPQRRCEPIPGLTHSYPPSTRPSYAGAGRLAAPGPDWMWIQGCWYWNGNDWAWLEQQWMPPGGQMSYVGPPEAGHDDYCVYQPNSQEVLPVAMPWPPDIGVGIGYSVQEVIVRGEYGSRHPGLGSHRGGGIRDHRNEPTRRRNEVVPAIRGGGDRPDYDERDEVYLGPGPVARPPVVAPPSPPRHPRPTAPGPGLVAPPAPPTVTQPPRPSAPPQGPAEPPPRRVRHQPPVSAPPQPSPPPRPSAPVTRPSAPAPAPAKPTPPRAAPKPPPRAAPRRPAPPRAAPAPAPSQPSQPARNRGARGR